MSTESVSVENVHSPRSPSGIHRWAHCLDSVRAQEGLPDVVGIEAATGTLFHTLIANLLEKPILEASDYFGETRHIDGHDVTCDAEMVRHLEEGVEYVQSLRGKVYVEQHVSLERWMPGEWGTTDVGVVQYEEGKYRIIDWKYGMTPVDAVGNEQIQAYALGFWNWHISRFTVPAALHNFTLEIRQPRVAGGNSAWDISLTDLLRYGEWLSERHSLSRRDDNERTPGKKQCHWCKAKSACKPYNDFVGDMIGLKFESAAAELPPVPTRVMTTALTPEQRSHVLMHWPMIQAWAKRLQADGLNDALKGLPTPGLKAIYGRSGAREWADPKEAEIVLRRLLDERAVTVQPLSPTEAEKNLTKQEFASLKALITQEPGKPKLVGVDEKGTPVVNYDSKFAELAEATGEE